MAEVDETERIPAGVADENADTGTAGGRTCPLPSPPVCLALPRLRGRRRPSATGGMSGALSASLPATLASLLLLPTAARATLPTSAGPLRAAGTASSPSALPSPPPPPPVSNGFVWPARFVRLHARTTVPAVDATGALRRARDGVPSLGSRRLGDASSPRLLEVVVADSLAPPLGEGAGVAVWGWRRCGGGGIAFSSSLPLGYIRRTDAHASTWISKRETARGRACRGDGWLPRALN